MLTSLSTVGARSKNQYKQHDLADDSEHQNASTVLRDVLVHLLSKEEVLAIAATKTMIFFAPRVGFVFKFSIPTELKNDCAGVTYGHSAGRRWENLDSRNKFLM